MAVTLEQARLNVQDDIQAGVIDEFRKSSYLLDTLTFDDAVSPAGNSSTLTYGYTRLITQPSADFREVNHEYDPSTVEKQRYTVDLKIFGGSFEIDRVLTSLKAFVDEVELQLGQKVKAAKSLFHDTVINGDSAVNAVAFDGLDKAVTGTDTEYGTGAYIDLSTTTAIDANYRAFIDEMELFLAQLDEVPTALMMNSLLKAKIAAVARRAGYFTQSEDAFGRPIDSYKGIPLVDLGAKPASSSPVVGIATRTIAGQQRTGLTDMYAAAFALDAFHGVSLAEGQLVKTWLPDFQTAGAVKKGEVEMVAAVALKRTKAAGVFRNIKVQ